MVARGCIGLQLLSGLHNMCGRHSKACIRHMAVWSMPLTDEAGMVRNRPYKRMWPCRWWRTNSLMLDTSQASDRVQCTHGGQCHITFTLAPEPRTPVTIEA